MVRLGDVAVHLLEIPRRYTGFMLSTTSDKAFLPTKAEAEQMSVGAIRSSAADVAASMMRLAS